MNGISQVVIAIGTVVSAPVFLALVQWLREMRGEKARAAKEQQEQEHKAKQAEVDRAKLLADAQAIAQTTAIESTSEALKVVSRQCKDCIDELHGLRDITGRLVDAVEALMASDTPETRAGARAAVRASRAAM